MSNRSFVRDVLQFLQEVDETFEPTDFADPRQVHDALRRMWGLVGGLEAVALRRASEADRDAYRDSVLLPRARRQSELLAELVPAPRADKDGMAW